MADPLSDVYKSGQSPSARRGSRGLRLHERGWLLPARAPAKHDGLIATWIPGYRRPEEIVSIVVPPCDLEALMLAAIE